jgi:hypothetical protein
MSMRKAFLLLLFALIGCANNKPAATTSQNNKDAQWCEKLSKTDSDFKNMLNEIVKTGSAIMGDNNEIVGYCHCISITKCNDIDYCSIEQCPEYKSYFLDNERTIETN